MPNKLIASPLKVFTYIYINHIRQEPQKIAKLVQGKLKFQIIY
jgi:hypothetical protein